jgi:hypothetical protein
MPRLAASTIRYFAAAAAAHRVTMTRLGRPDPTGRPVGGSQGIQSVYVTIRFDLENTVCRKGRGAWHGRCQGMMSLPS